MFRWRSPEQGVQQGARRARAFGLACARCHPGGPRVDPALGWRSPGPARRVRGSLDRRRGSISTRRRDQVRPRRAGDCGLRTTSTAINCMTRARCGRGRLSLDGSATGPTRCRVAPLATSAQEAAREGRAISSRSARAISLPSASHALGLSPEYSLRSTCVAPVMSSLRIRMPCCSSFSH